ncbi:rod shape-determining protein [Alicyclobacillus fodiniaquatilis]|jgi:rod shape-determining protein MreB|uniref:Rod shape-determining protein n=1 Tax=Alicyclobacillus fodiniaquatilis TaxID=1661150 RepID=A0ABW4JCU0_9BACL
MSLLIDFGTSVLRMLVARTDNLIEAASMVALQEGAPTVAGDEALKMVGRTPKSVQLIAPIEAGVVKDGPAATDMLKLTIASFSSRGGMLRMPMTFALPANLTSVERRGLEEVAKNAGARQVEFYDSLVAAAAGADIEMDQPHGALVVDMGAGKTEVGLLSMRGIVEMRRMPYGGQAIDQTIIENIRREHAFIIGQQSVERVKQLLGEAEAGDEPTFEVIGRSLTTGLPAKMRVDRDLFWQPLSKYYSQVKDLIRQTIEHCPPELVGDVMDNGVALVGGGALGYRAQAELAERIEVPIRVAAEPTTCVIRGLAKLVASQRKSTEKVRLRA